MLQCIERNKTHVAMPKESVGNNIGSLSGINFNFYSNDKQTTLAMYNLTESIHRHNSIAARISLSKIADILLHGLLFVCRVKSGLQRKVFLVYVIVIDCQPNNCYRASRYKFQSKNELRLNVLQ